MWNKENSLTLSKVCTILFAVGLVIIICIAPWLMKWAIEYSASLQPSLYTFLLATIYIGAIPAAFLLFSLYKLLHNLGNEIVFAQQNVRLLRHISWCCVFGAIICFISAFYYIAWVAVSIAAAFVALIVRIIKNVFAYAIAIKEENDLTI